MEQQERYYDEYEIDLREYLKVLWDGKWLIIGLFILAVLAAAVYSQFFINPVYQTEAAIQLSNAGGVYSNPGTVVQLLQSNNLIKPVMGELDQDFSASRLKSYIASSIKAGIVGKTDIIEISVKNTDPGTARQLLRGVIDSFMADAAEYYNMIVKDKQENLAEIKNNLQSVTDKIEAGNQKMDNISALEMDPAEKSILLNSLTTRLDSLLKQQNTLMRMEQSLESQLLNLYPAKELDSPYLPENPISPNKKLNVAIAGVLALMLGVFIVFFREFMKEEEVQNNKSLKG